MTFSRTLNFPPNMANQPISVDGLMTAMPVETRGRILSGMRWTLWLSCLAMPMGLGTSVLLARTSPEAIGTYGLLTLYLSIVTTFFYVGGDTVVIKFVPLLAGKQRMSFLVSYFSVICLVVLGWMAVASIWSNDLHYIFGDSSSKQFYLLILAVSPIHICFSMVASTLKGMLEIRWAQLLLRLVTIGSFVIYLLFFAYGRKLLSSHYIPVIWSVYLSLAAIGTLWGAHHLFQLNGWESLGADIHFFLPRGFWRYVSATQQLSLVSFFSSRIDYLLILNFGGLETLGKWVAVSTIGGSVVLLNSLLFDTLLPSLTNFVAAQDLEGAREIFNLHMRVIFVVSTAITCGLVLFARQLILILGPKYSSLIWPVMVMVLLVGLASPGAAGGALLSSVGKQQNAVWISVIQAIVFVSLLSAFWSKLHLLGAALAYGAAMLIANVLLLIVAKKLVYVRFAVGRDYSMFALVSALCAIVATWIRPSVAAACLVWMVAMSLFLFLSRYTAQEGVALSKCIFPHDFVSDWPRR